MPVRSIAISTAPGATLANMRATHHRVATPMLALVVAITTGTVVWASLRYQHETRRGTSTPPATLIISSVPTGARVQIDGHEKGHTPARIVVSPGAHALVASGFGSEQSMTTNAATLTS